MIQIGEWELAEEGYLNSARCGRCGREYVQIWAETSSLLGLGDYRGTRSSQGWVGDRMEWAKGWVLVLFLFCLGFMYNNLLFDFHSGNALIKENKKELNIRV